MGATEDVVRTPKHPYTASLLAASPRTNPDANRKRVLLPGEPPNPVNLPTGCNFAPRCPKADEQCYRNDPERSEFTEDDHEAACYFPVEDVETELLERYIEAREDGVEEVLEDGMAP
jgi:peptide/nickel transport system ATP-binding protein